MNTNSISVQLGTETSLSARMETETSLSAGLATETSFAGQLGTGAAVVNDYLIRTEEIEDGHRLTITRGSEVQSIDVMNGAKGDPGEDAPQDAVLYTPQSLTVEQQAQVRENIGIAEQGDMMTYEVGPERQFESFTDCLRALEDNEQSKRIDIYEGTYDIYSELGGQTNPMVPPNTEIVGHGRVELMASDGSDLSIVNLSGSAKLKNLMIACSVGYACVRADGPTSGKYDGVVWEIENCALEYSKAEVMIGGGGLCCVDTTLRRGVELHLRNTVCKAGAYELKGTVLKLTNRAIASNVSPRVRISDCVLDGGIDLYSHTSPTVNPFTVVDVQIENSHITGNVYKEALEESSHGFLVDCFRVTYINTPHTSRSYGISNLIPDVVYDNLDKKKSVLYTAQELTEDQKAKARENIDCVRNIICETEWAFQSVPTELPGMIEDSGNALIVHGSEDAFGLPMVSNSENLFPYPYEGAKTNGNTGVTFSTYYRWITLSGDGTGSGTATFYPLGTDYRDISELGLAPGDTYRFCIKANKKPNVTTGNVELRFLSDTGSTLVNQIAYIPTNDALLTESSEYTVPEGAVLFRLRILATATAAWDDVCIYPILLKASATLDKLGAELAEGKRAELPYAQIMGMAQVNTFDYEHSYRYKIDAKTYIDNHMSEAKMTYVTPEQFGAVGDGISDDAQAIAACFAEAQVQGVPVRMDQAYCTSQPVVIGSNMDVEINRLKYTGADCAVILNGAASALRVNQLDSAGMGLMLRAEDVMVQHNAVQLGSVTSKSHGISLEIADGSKMAIAQNRIDFRHITAGGDDCYCITNRRREIPTYITENSFFGGQCSNADWAYFGSGGNSKFYSIQVEGKIKGGFCFVGGANALIVGDRHVESMRDGEYPYLKIYSEETPSSSYSGSITGLTWISPSSISVNEIDVSGVATKNIAGDGESYITSSGSLGRILCTIGSYKETGTDSAAHYQIFGRSAIIWCNRLIFQDVPDKHYIVTRNLDLRTIDADTPGMPTVFEIGCTDCVIHLHPTYCFMGLSRFHVVQTEDYQATIYDSYSGNAIFDGSTYGAGTFEVTTRINGDNARINGEGMIWKVRRIGLNIDADGNATI